MKEIEESRVTLFPHSLLCLSRVWVKANQIVIIRLWSIITHCCCFLFIFIFFATFLKYDELMQFSLFHLFTDRRKVVVLKSLWRDFDLREAHKKKEGKCFVNQEKFARDEVNGRSLSMQLNSNNFRVVVKIENGLLEQRFSIKKRLRRLMICTCVAPGSCRKLNTQLRSV